MKGASPAFAENDNVGGTYKASLFKTIFKDRKNLLEGYPGVKKGLAFPEPCLKFGSSTYTFKTTDVVDKVHCKHEDVEFQARYKKDTGKWDLSVKQPLSMVGMPGMIGLFKYEEKGGAQPSYVFGVNFAKAALTFNGKMNVASGVFKASCLYNLNDIAAGVKAGADVKGNLMDLNPATMKYNLGASYVSGAGVTAVGVNDKMVVTVNHSLMVQPNTSAIIEAGAALKPGGTAAPLCVAVGHQLDKAHQIRARANQKGQVQCCIKKDFSPNLSLLFATCVDLNNAASMKQMPAFGFKVCTKA